MLPKRRPYTGFSMLYYKTHWIPPSPPCSSLPSSPPSSSPPSSSSVSASSPIFNFFIQGVRLAELKDLTTGETRRIHLCYRCNPYIYPRGKPIDVNDWMARKDEKGNWVCGDCQVEELNKRKIRVLGPNHPDSKFIIEQEDIKTKAYNNYAMRVNENMKAGLKYRKNKYTGMISFD